jgi:hypothetical protein
MTTIVATALIALGSSAGWFSDAKASPKAVRAQAAAPAPSLDDHAAALLYLAAVSGAQAEPNVRTETIYRYVDAPPKSAPVTAARADTSAPVTAPAQPASEPAAPPPTVAPPKATPTTPPPPAPSLARAAQPEPAEHEAGGSDD